MTDDHDEVESPWRPTATPERLLARARMLSDIRAFFSQRGVLEVETPLLGQATVTDVHIESFRVRPALPGDPERFLQTSPEYAMKRLLAAGSGPIYQICKAFRAGEAGGRHNPEFTMLEWYRPGWDHHRLMDEVDELLRLVLGTPPAEQTSFGDLFRDRLGLDPHEASATQLRRRATEEGLEAHGLDPEDRDGWLDLLLSCRLEPHLGTRRPLFVYDYPASQAALARLRHSDDGPPVAERFEVYVHGTELANGYHELTDAEEQRRRFTADREERRRRGLTTPAADERLLTALAHGLPACAGVSIGLDRLLLVACGATSLAEVLTFPADRA